MPARADPSNDPAILLERRRAQNRLAQQRFRKKKLALKKGGGETSEAGPSRTFGPPAVDRSEFNTDAAAGTSSVTSGWHIGQWEEQPTTATHLDHGTTQIHAGSSGSLSSDSSSGSSEGSPPAVTTSAGIAASGLPISVPDHQRHPSTWSNETLRLQTANVEGLHDADSTPNRKIHSTGTLQDILQDLSAYQPTVSGFDFLGPTGATNLSWPNLSPIDGTNLWAQPAAQGGSSQRLLVGPPASSAAPQASHPQSSPASTFYQQATWCPRAPAECQPLDQMLARARLTPRQAGELFLELAQKVTHEKGLLAVILQQTGGLSLSDLRRPLHDIIDGMEASNEGRRRDNQRGQRGRASPLSPRRSRGYDTAENLSNFGSYHRSNPVSDRLSGLYPRFDFAKVLYINAVTLGFREDDLRVQGAFDILPGIWQKRSQPALTALREREEVYDSDESIDSDDDDPRLYAGMSSSSSSSSSGSIWQSTVTPTNMTKADERRRLRRLRDSPHIHPTPIQLAYPHSVLVDVLPWPAVRDELILLGTPSHQVREEHRARDPKSSEVWKRNAGGGSSSSENQNPAGTATVAASGLDLVEVKCDLIGLPFGARGEGHTFRVHGDDPLDPYAWEIPEQWARKYLRLGVRSLLDAGVIRRSNWWRRMRGLPDMDLDDEIEMLKPRRRRRRDGGGHDGGGQFGGEPQSNVYTTTANTAHGNAPPTSAAGAYPAPHSSDDPFRPVWIHSDSQEDILGTAASMALL